MTEINKYQDVLKKYKTKLNDADIATTVKEIIDAKWAANNTKEVYKKIYSCIDLTSLHATDTREDIWKLTTAVNDFDDIADTSNVAAICVYPNLVATVKEALTTNVKIVSVAGGFPASQTFTEIKIAEAALAIADGADEIDIVINVGYFLDENYQELCEEIDEIKAVCRNVPLKVILETGALKTAENTFKAAILAMYSGADFLKTSTGKDYPGASLEAAYVMCTAIKQYKTKGDRIVGFKAAGGITTAEEAVKYYTIVQEVLGEEYLTKEYFRIGASSLAEDLLRKIH